MSIEIRNVSPDEFVPFVEALSTAFLDRPDVARIAEAVKPFWEPQRTWGAFDGDRVCGTFRSWATELTAPGGARLPASAIAAVTVLPTHRRRGILTSLVAAEHAAIRERGEAVGLLHSSEYQIYGRYGYGPACRVATWTLDAGSTRFHGAPVSGVELVLPGPETRDAMEAVFEAWRPRRAGEIRRRPFRWDDELGLIESPWGERWKGFLAFHRDAAGSIDGYVRYRAEEKWEHRQPRGILKVNELHALTDEAYHALWRHLAETDLVATVVAEGRSPSDRLPWLLTNPRAAAMSDVGEGLWVRLFDVARALEARSWERSGTLVLEVIDADTDVPARLALDVSPEGATCRPTDRSVDLTLPVAALGAAYLGGTRLRDAVIATGADEHRDGALAIADSLLRSSDEPWCSTFF
jgi:predicted acetyltransferase